MNEHQSAWVLASFKQCLGAGRDACKGAFLLNGAAAIALLTFVGTLATKSDGTISVKGFLLPMFLFGIGSFLGAGGAGLTYLAQGNYTMWNEEGGKFWRNIAIGVVVAAFLLFPCGLVTSVYAFSGTSQAPEIPIPSAEGGGGLAVYKQILDTIVAFGTLAVAVFAIWGAKFRLWFAGPKLELTLSPTSDVMTDHNAKPIDIGDIECRHIVVENGRPYEPALDVRVYIIAIFTQLAGAFTRVPFASRVQLTWQDQHNDRQQKSARTVRTSLLCNFAFFKVNLHGNRDNLRLAHPRTYPFNFPPEVEVGKTVRVVIWAEGINASTNELIVEIGWKASPESGGEPVPVYKDVSGWVWKA